MVHQMRLQDSPFNSIKAGTKDIEMRLYDEKRRAIKPGDIIEFTNIVTDEKISAEVYALHIFATFKDMYLAFDKTRLGYAESEIAHPTDMSKFYPEEEIKEFNVVGIEIRLIK
ncbi:MAG: RNA-binding protein [Clostridia bacterium]|nr:RNA-binding protein [Clostridia bacterium]